ncbi:LTA synthase family protein [Pedobacter sp. AW31-3R]|uniref:LTA synthase family protein n=1 Tax=Pedobacter sp. AW31-3R TaxID=3445781 RepID=UPI003FA0C54C
MLKALIFFARFFVLWLLFFLLDRLIFIGINLEQLKNSSATEILASCYYSLRLDLSMVAYMAVAPILFFLFFFFIPLKKKVPFSWISVYNKVLVVIFSILGVANFNIYREWGSKINAKALGFAITSPNEAIASSASSPVFLSLSVLAVLICAGLALNKWLTLKNIELRPSPVLLKLFFAVLLVGVNFLMIRGGLGVSPNNQSMAYYCDVPILNHAAVNTEWGLVSSILANKRSSNNPDLYFPNDEAEKIVKDLYAVEKDSTTLVLKTKRPNVVVIIMESFTADLTKTLGNEDGITPNLDRMMKEGILFSNIYSTGNRTDKGIIGTLAGFPSIAAENIVKWPEKLEKIPAISQTFAKNGYQTSFFYGGESEFENYKVFIMSHDYQLLVDKNSFASKDMNSKWGAYDGVVFNRQLQELNKTKEPFFSTQMTLTNHEPFEVPGKPKFGNKDNVEKFKSTAFYTDSCLNSFLMEAKKQPWYKNTLFIFVADHGHILPKIRQEVYVPQRYHIPLLFFGDVIKEEYKGKRFDQVGSQIDIASTLLHQLDMDAKPFIWSKNLLNPYTKAFAWFSWDNGMGFIDHKQCVTFDNIGKMVLYNDQPKDVKYSDTLSRNGKAYLQSVHQHFIGL